MNLWPMGRLGVVSTMVVALAACRCTSQATVPWTPMPPPGPLPPGAPPRSPVILYTDLASAPAGAFVTLWGRRFGAERGAVLAGEAVVPTIVSWSDGVIELQLPAGLPVGPTALRVRTAGAASPPMPFAIHPGDLYFVSPLGNDAWTGKRAAPAGGDGPFRTLARAGQALRPGDVAYVRAGTYTDEHRFEAVWSFLDVASGTADRPIAVVGYPAERATLGDHSLLRAFSFFRGDDQPPLSYLTVAKLDLRPGCVGIPLPQHVRGRWRRGPALQRATAEPRPDRDRAGVLCPHREQPLLGDGPRKVRRRRGGRARAPRR